MELRSMAHLSAFDRHLTHCTIALPFGNKSLRLAEVKPHTIYGTLEPDMRRGHKSLVLQYW